MAIPILAIVMIFSIPLVAILSDHFLKMKKLKVHGGDTLSVKDKKKIQQLLNENADLRHRVENLETIISDPDALALNQATSGSSDADQKLLQQQIDFLAEELAKIKTVKKQEVKEG